MAGAGFEPAKAEPSDLQSDPFDRSGTPPEAPSLARERLTKRPAGLYLKALVLRSAEQQATGGRNF